MSRPSAIPALIFVVILGLGLAIAYLHHGAPDIGSGIGTGVASLVLAAAAASATKIANQWERVIVLRLGRFRSMNGPGLFFIIPIVDSVAYWIDIRVITSSFKAEKTLTKDTVPVDVDAVLFGRYWIPKRQRWTLPTISPPSVGLRRRLCVMSSERRCFRICSKVVKESATNFGRSSMSVPNHGASTSFQWRSRMF